MKKIIQCEVTLKNYESILQEVFKLLLEDCANKQMSEQIYAQIAIDTLEFAAIVSAYTTRVGSKSGWEGESKKSLIRNFTEMFEERLKAGKGDSKNG